ncbi:MAG: hypothetical protein JSS56_20570 [Proteobacteria bacterium]|nr:hypothetical protein [Pseudomonadota bacterium]
MIRNDPLLMARIGLTVLDALPARAQGGHVVLVTGASLNAPSLVSDLLAQEFASKLDGDVVWVQAMKPCVGEVAAAIKPDTPARGLAALMAGGALDTKRLPKPDASGLFRMPADTWVRHDDFFRAEAVTSALATLRARFRLSIVNGPALGACGALIQQADRVLLAVDAQEASPRTVRRAMAKAGIDPSDIHGAILTNARNSRRPGWLASE